MPKMRCLYCTEDTVVKVLPTTERNAKDMVLKRGAGTADSRVRIKMKDNMLPNTFSGYLTLLIDSVVQTGRSSECVQHLLACP